MKAGARPSPNSPHWSNAQHNERRDERHNDRRAQAPARLCRCNPDGPGHANHPASAIQQTPTFQPPPSPRQRQESRESGQSASYHSDPLADVAEPWPLVCSDGSSAFCLACGAQLGLLIVWPVGPSNSTRPGHAVSTYARRVANGLRQLSPPCGCKTSMFTTPSSALPRTKIIVPGSLQRLI